MSQNISQMSQSLPENPAEPSNKYRKTSTGRLSNGSVNQDPGKRKYAHCLPPSRKKTAPIQQTGSSVLPVKTAPPEPPTSGRGKKIQTRAPDARGAVPNILDSNIVNGRRAYYDSYSKLLSYEIQEEMKEVDDRLLNWTKTKLIRDGCTLLDLKGAGSGYVNNELTLTFEPKNGGFLSSNKFVQGDIVVITEANTSCTVRLEGLVSSVGKATINISCRNLPDNFQEKIWRIDRGANQNAFTRMSEALKVFSSNRAETDDYLKEWARNTKIPHCYLPGSGKQSPFKSIIIDNIQEAEKQASFPSILNPLHDPAKIKSIMEDWPLNNSQYQTIIDVLGRRLSLIQGPPGTGKTHTAIHLLLLLVKLYENDNVPILATAYTNVATDNLLQGLRSHGIEALRLGRPVKVRDELRDCTLQSHLERHPQRPMLDQLREELSKLRGDAYHEKLREIKLLESSMTTEIVAKARVICTTCIGAGDPILTDQYFPLVVIDESTQAIEPAILVPLTKGAQQVIFLGDHYQLPPTVKSSKAELLKDSLFHRLVKEGNLKPFVLNSQYRMHPLISQFPSAHFYHGQIKDAISAKNRPLPTGFPWKDNKPLVLLHIDGKEVSTETGSRSNPVEATIVMDIVRQFLVDQDLTRSDIGIVTPYAGQVNHLTLLLKKDPLLSVATDRDVMDEGEDSRTQLAGGLNVASVDGFQGREKEVIIFSSVRSNTTGTVGFLSDWRRLNVAITRARRGLIVVGNINTLANDPHWHAWLTWMGAQGLILDYNDWKTGKETELPVPALPSSVESEGTPNKAKSNVSPNRTPTPKKQNPAIMELTLPVSQNITPTRTPNRTPNRTPTPKKQPAVVELTLPVSSTSQNIITPKEQTQPAIQEIKAENKFVMDFDQVIPLQPNSLPPSMEELLEEQNVVAHAEKNSAPFVVSTPSANAEPETQTQPETLNIENDMDLDFDLNTLNTDFVE